MNLLKKFAAGLTAFSVAATMAACSTPTIGGGSAVALTIDDYDVNAGIFIFYTLTSYYDALNVITENSSSTDTAPTSDDVKDSHIDNLDAADWIQNKAVEYCSTYVAVEKEFEKTGEELTQEELDDIDSNVEQYAGLQIYHDNGIGEDSVRDILENEYKRQHVFDYYYGFDGEWGMSEDDLKDYFNDNFARVKYVTMSLLDAEGNALDDDGKNEIMDMAEKYADMVNAESDSTDKLYKMDEAQEEYDEYVEEQEAALETGTTTTTTTTATTTSEGETTTTTTTDPHANEKVIQKATTVTTSEEDADVTTTTVTESASTKSVKKLNNYVFDELELNKAVVFPDEENDTVYVVIRADLRERMTSDDLWTDDYIKSMQTLNFDSDFSDFLDSITENYSPTRNKSAFRRYSPFKLILETDSQAQ